MSGETVESQTDQSSLLPPRLTHCLRQGRKPHALSPLIDTRARFHKPSTYGDTVTIETRIAKFGRTSFEIEYRLLRGGDLAVEGFEKRVLVARDPVDPEKLKPFPIPTEVIALFERD